VNQKRAKELRRLAKYDPNGPKEYEDIEVKKVTVARFNSDGSVEDVIRTRVVTINKTKQTYNKWKKAYYLTKSRGQL